MVSVLCVVLCGTINGIQECALLNCKRNLFPINECHSSDNKIGKGMCCTGSVHKTHSFLWMDPLSIKL